MKKTIVANPTIKQGVARGLAANPGGGDAMTTSAVSREPSARSAADAATPDFAAAYLSMIKRAVTGFLQLGGGRVLAEHHAADHYDATSQQWTIGPHGRPHTLLTGDQLDLIERCVLRVEADGIPGDLIEAGVWRGGAIVYLRAILNAHVIVDRQVVAADSFQGIPLNTRFRHDPVDRWSDRWQASLDEVRETIARYGLLDERVELFPGWFEDSLPMLGERRFALVRLDSDSHDSVMTSLEHLYPRLSDGGIIIIDDWHLIGCRFAVNNFRDRQCIDEPVSVEADNGWWIKRHSTK